MAKKSLRCILFGHDPRGPVIVDMKYYYWCNRCEQLIYFVASQHRWMVKAK